VVNPRESPKRWREAAAVTLLAATLAAVMTYPAVVDLDEAGRVDSHDGRWAIWNVGWIAHALVTDPTELYQTNIFHPYRDSLVFAEANLFAGLLAVPAYLATGSAFVAHNSVLLIAFMLSFLGMYALTRYLTHSPAASIAPAIAFAFCPYIFARVPHISLQLMAGMPFALVALHRLVDRRTVGRAVVLGAVLAAQALATGYYGIFAGLSVGLGVLFFGATRGLWRDRMYWLTCALAALVAITLVLPFFLPYVELQRETGFGRSLEEARTYSADWRAYFASSAWTHRWMLPLLGSWREVLFPGFLVTLGGAVGAWLVATRATRPRQEIGVFYGLVASLAVWLSYGPQAGLYTVLYEALPVMSLIRAPVRVAVLVPLSLGVLCALGLSIMGAGWDQRRRRVVGAVAALLVTLELVEAPIQWYPASSDSPAYAVLAELPVGPVLELPFYDEAAGFEWHTVYLLASTRHWKRVVNGYGDFFPEEFVADAPMLAGFPSTESFARLAQMDVRYVLVHFNLRGSPEQSAWGARVAPYRSSLDAVYEGDDAALYEIISRE
jgi:hypothetical protein